jgi:hypothetical protein
VPPGPPPAWMACRLTPRDGTPHPTLAPTPPTGQARSPVRPLGRYGTRDEATGHPGRDTPPMAGGPTRPVSRSLALLAVAPLPPRRGEACTRRAGCLPLNGRARLTSAPDVGGLGSTHGISRIGMRADHPTAPAPPSGMCHAPEAGRPGQTGRCKHAAPPTTPLGFSSLGAAPNATRQLLGTVGATQERTLFPGSCTRGVRQGMTLHDVLAEMLRTCFKLCRVRT